MRRFLAIAVLVAGLTVAVALGFWLGFENTRVRDSRQEIRQILLNSIFSTKPRKGLKRLPEGEDRWSVAAHASNVAPEVFLVYAEEIREAALAADMVLWGHRVS
jgi:hypothetical protein